MKTLVTGSSGFVGSKLVQHLIDQGDTVVTYDLADDNDILNLKQLKATFKHTSPDRVFHLAAQAFLGPGENAPYKDLDVNAKGMINLLKCLEEYDIPMVYTSSGAVYGKTPDVPHREDSPCLPMSNYGVSKLAAEYYLRKWVHTKGVNARILRFSSVHGPGRKHGPVNIFTNLALEGKDLTVFGDGEQTRDLAYIEDACRGAVIVLENGVPGEVYNIGSGKGTSVNTVAKVIGDLLNVKVTHIDHEFSEFDIKYSAYDLTKSRAIGYEPEYTPVEGILRTVNQERDMRG